VKQSFGTYQGCCSLGSEIILSTSTSIETSTWRNIQFGTPTRSQSYK